MDLYQLIKQDHQRIKRLFERVTEAEAGTPSHERLFGDLKRALELHAELEEKHFYPALQSHEEAEDLVEEALEEHGAIEEALRALDRVDKEDDNWAEELAELQEDVEHHVEVEETEIFALAARLIEPAEAEAIAGAMEKDKAAAPKADT